MIKLVLLLLDSIPRIIVLILSKIILIPIDLFLWLINRYRYRIYKKRLYEIAFLRYEQMGYKSAFDFIVEKKLKFKEYKEAH
jgi:hypothetical protein